MTHTRGYARNKESAAPAKQSGSNAVCIASARARFGLISPYRKTMTREQAAAKWNCSPGTIDKYAA